MPEVVTWAVVGGVAAFIVGMISAISERTRRKAEIARKAATLHAHPERLYSGERKRENPQTFESMAGSSHMNDKEDQFAAASNSSR